MNSAKQNITEWVNSYTDELVRWATYKVKDQHLAEDLVQETFVAAYKNIEKFKQQSSPKTWLFSILRNKIADHFRSKITQFFVRTSDLSTEGSNDILDRIFNQHGEWNEQYRPSEWNTDDVELLDIEEFKDILQACLELLNEKSYLSIQYKYLKQLDGKEICKELGITPSNFWQLLHRAKIQVRACVEEKWFT